MFHIIQHNKSWWILGFGKLWFSGSGTIKEALAIAQGNGIALCDIDERKVA